MDIQDDDVIEVRWATYNGTAVWVYLVAMLVDEILTGPQCVRAAG